MLLKNRRSLLHQHPCLPVFVLLTTNSATPRRTSAGALFVIGLAIAYGLAATSILGYALTVARDREKGVFQRLRVTPAPTWTIMTSRLVMQTLANLIIALVVVIVGIQLHHISLSAGTVRTGLGHLGPRRRGVPQHRPGARRSGEVRRHRQRRRRGSSSSH